MGLRKLAGALASALPRLIGLGISSRKSPVARYRPSSRWALVLVSLAALMAASWALATNYSYDANGRLVGVTNDSGQTARYAYDNLGNIVRIDRPAATDLEIYSFSPGRAAIGAVITVGGNGFSATPGSNIPEVQWRSRDRFGSHDISIDRNRSSRRDHWTDIGHGRLRNGHQLDQLHCRRNCAAPSD